MKRLIYILIAVAMTCPMQSCANSGSQPHESAEASDAQENSEASSEPSDATYEAAAPSDPDAQKIGSLLMEASKLTKDTNIPLFFARKFIGVPYVAHTLEVNDDERLVVNTRQLDCTTFVETVTALTLCAYNKEYSYDAYLHHLQQMRYRGGRIEDYTSRIHYFTEWIVENLKAGIVKEIQAPNPPFSAVQTVKVDYMSRHPQSYKALKAHPEYVAAIRKMEQGLTGLKFRFIPKAQINDSKAMREAVHDGDIIAITCNKPGLDIAHLGFAVWHQDGLHLLNASQIHKKVIDEPMTLREYLGKHPSHTGIRIVRINKK